MKSPQHRFVVDADIARAAGPEPKDKTWADNAKVAFDVLDAIRKNERFVVVFGKKLKQEGDRHQGNTAQRWLADMISSSRMVMAKREDTRWVLELIEAHLPKQNRKEAEKDAHLIALAHSPGDRRILSNDGKARKKYASLPDDRVAVIHWVEASKRAFKWLMDGAADEPRWQLGQGRRTHKKKKL